jgi:CBS domain-containing protein
MKIGDLIRKPAQTLLPDASCEEAAALMRDENVGSVVVADGGKPAGVVTDRDIVVRVVAAGGDPARTPVRDAMSDTPVFVARSRTVGEAISYMRDMGIRRVPVVDDEGTLHGVVSLDDLLLALADQLGGLAEAVRKEIGASG